MTSENSQKSSQDDVLRKDHEVLIMEALSNVNELSEKINEKDREYSYALKKFNNYTTYVDNELMNVSDQVVRSVQRVQPYFDNKKRLQEIQEVVKRISKSISGYKDNRQELLDALASIENQNGNPKSLTPEQLVKIDLLTKEINTLEETKIAQENYLKAAIATVASIGKFCANEEKTFPKSIERANKFYEYKEELFQGLKVHQNTIKKLEHENHVLKANYKEAMDSLNSLSMKIKHDNEVENNTSSKMDDAERKANSSSETDSSKDPSAQVNGEVIKPNGTNLSQQPMLQSINDNADSSAAP